jgi:putative tricarboxylic transport membrane protein
VFGIVGYWLRKLKYPLAPLVVALVLGDQTEKTLRQALIASGGNPLTLVGTPLAATLMALSVVMILLPFAKYLMPWRRRAAPSSAA